MSQKVIKAGDTLAVILPSEVIDALQLQEGSQVDLKLSEDQHYLLLTTGDTPIKGVDPLFVRYVSDFIEQYRPALEALAK